VRSLLLIAVLAGLVVPVAFAKDREPQKKFTKADQAKARAVSLRMGDFGAGWKQGPPSKQGESNPRCSTYDPDLSDLIETGSYDSPDFSRPDGTSVSSSSGVFKTVAMAKTGYTRLAVPQLPRCFAEIFKKGITKPNSATIFFSGRLPFPSVAERSSAYRIRASVKTPTVRVPATIDLVLFNKGRIDAVVIFIGIGQALPASFEQAAVAKIASRA
jgi:hypothetical protein